MLYIFGIVFLTYQTLPSRIFDILPFGDLKNPYFPKKGLKINIQKMARQINFIL